MKRERALNLPRQLFGLASLCVLAATLPNVEPAAAQDGRDNPYYATSPGASPAIYVIVFRDGREQGVPLASIARLEFRDQGLPQPTFSLRPTPQGQQGQGAYSPPMPAQSMPGQMPPAQQMMPPQPAPSQSMPYQPMPSQQPQYQPSSYQPTPQQPQQQYQPAPYQPAPQQPTPYQPMSSQPMSGQLQAGQSMAPQPMPGQAMPAPNAGPDLSGLWQVVVTDHGTGRTSNGRLELFVNGSAWTGRIWYAELGENWDNLDKVAIDARMGRLTFSRPNGGQYYTALFRGGALQGTVVETAHAYSWTAKR